MFERFLASFSVEDHDGTADHSVWHHALLDSATGYGVLAERLAGRAVDLGLYRFHDQTSGPKALRQMVTAFPEFAERCVPFGFDWLGRHFALDRHRTERGEPLVLMLEPGTGAVLEIPASFSDFHNLELVDVPDAAMARIFFKEWSSAHPSMLPLPFTKCVGYRVPLFLGGAMKSRISK